MLSRFSRVRLFMTLWTIAKQAPLYMGFSRQEYWSELPCPPPGDFPEPGIEPTSLALQADSLLLSHRGSPHALHAPSQLWQTEVSLVIAKCLLRQNCPQLRTIVPGIWTHPVLEIYLVINDNTLDRHHNKMSFKKLFLGDYKRPLLEECYNSFIQGSVFSKENSFVGGYNDS